MRPEQRWHWNGAVHGLDGEVAGGILEIHAGGNGFDVHVAEDVGDVHAAGIVMNLKLGILGNADFVIGTEIFRRSVFQNRVAHDVDAVAGLLDFDIDLVGGAVGDDHDFGFGPGAHGDGAVGIVDIDDRVGVDLEMLFQALGEDGRGAEEQQAGHDQAGAGPFERRARARMIRRRARMGRTPTVISVARKNGWGVHRPNAPRSLISASKSAFC